MKVQTPMLKMLTVIDTKNPTRASIHMGEIPATESLPPPPPSPNTHTGYPRNTMPNKGKSLSPQGNLYIRSRHNEPKRQYRQKCSPWLPTKNKNK